MSACPPKILNTQKVFSGKIFNIHQVDLAFSNGEIRQYEYAEPGSTVGVLILPLLDKKTILLIREYAVNSNSYVLNFPRGGVPKNEDFYLSAERELKEETGYGAKHLQLLKTMNSVSGYIKDTMYYLIATDLYPESLVGDEPEPLEVIKWPIEKLDDLLTEPGFNEARNIAALYLLERFLNER